MEDGPTLHTMTLSGSGLVLLLSSTAITREPTLPPPLGHDHAVAQPSGTCTGTLRVTEGLNSTFVDLTVRNPVTYYVRTDGVSRYIINNTSGQCDGKHDAAYPGTGTNQACAFNDIRLMWVTNFTYDASPESYFNFYQTAGGDTTIVRGGQYRLNLMANWK